MGVSRRESAASGAARRGADPRIARGIGNYGEGSVSGSFHLRLPRLSRIPSAHAALSLQKMGGPAMAARTSGIEMGTSPAVECLSDAAGRRTARADAARSPMNRFLRDRSGVTAIEYGLMVALMTLAIVGAISTLGNQAFVQLFQKIAGSLS